MKHFQRKPSFLSGGLKRFCAVLVLFFLSGFFAAGQTQADRDAPRRDIFVILDVSGSMAEQNRFGNVQSYIEQELINGLAKDGDRFTLLSFGDDVRERFSRTISSAGDRSALAAELKALEPDNNYTDIGTAMEQLAKILEKSEEPGVRRVIIFITDGINAPPPGSKYRGVNLALDDRFKAAGEKISKSGWFLYVIGIGGKTDAQTIAEAVPGSVLQATGADLAGVDVHTYAEQVEAEARAREEEAQAEEEARRLEEKRNAGIAGLLRRIAAGLGISLPVLVGGFLFILLILVLLVLLMGRIFRTVEVIVTDEKDTLIRKLPPFAGIALNSPAGVLPGLGGDNSQVLRIERSAFGLKVRIMDASAIADNSPYKQGGIMPLKGVINLANGRIVRASIR